MVEKPLRTRARGPAPSNRSIPLFRNVTIFALQYAVAAATAMKLQPHAAVAIIGHAVSGATAGYFSGWAVALLRRYRNFGSGETTN